MLNNNELLLEGGAAGHMNHLYDNGDLSFGKLKQILSSAADGKLEGTEKTDGQNLMISYSVQDGRAKGVRNKSEIKAGGLNPEQLAAKFADRENPALKETFSDALKAFERTVQSLSHKEQIELFGPETNIFYNAEVMDPRTPNVVNYDTKALVIHRAGHFEYDRKAGQKTNRDLTDVASRLERVIQDSQEKLKHDNYGVQVNAVRKLKALSDKRPLNTAISKINSLLSSINSLIASDQLKLNDNSTIDEYMMARIYILINSTIQKGKVRLYPVAKMNIAKRILGIKGISIKDISAKISKEELEFVKEHFLNDTSKKEMLKTAIAPLENVVSDFAVEMLKGLQSAFVLDNAKEVQRLKKELQTAINAIESSGNEEAMSILKRQMTKLKSAENVDAAAEGFVFDYDGITYKFTGNFAPMNQILGLFKYGRGNVPPLQKLSEAKKGQTIAVIPGAFKPPHKGHLAMVKQYAKMADKVVVMVSPLARDLPNGKPVTFEVSKSIWDIYLKAEKLDKKVVIMNSPFSSPVRAAYEFVGNKDNLPEFAQPGQTVILGTSTKGGDESRFAKDVTKYARQGVQTQVVPIDSEGNISATDMRDAIANNDVKGLTKFLPDSVDKKKIAGYIMSLFSASQNISENVIYDIIIETIKKNANKYSLLIKKHVKKENMAGGSVAGYAAPIGKRMER